MRTEDLDRALRYPYQVPSSSYVFRTDGTTVPLNSDLAEVVGEREAVLAIGSNASPEQLRRKFGSSGQVEEIPVVTTHVEGYDVVYAARVTSYGAIPATILASPGTAVTVFTTFLTPSQRSRMDETESLGHAYGLTCLEVDVGHSLRLWASCYKALSGPLRLDGSPVALASVLATDRKFSAMNEEAVLSAVATRLGMTMEGLVEAALRGRDERRMLNERIVALSTSFP